MTENLEELTNKIKEILKKVKDNPTNINYWGSYKKIQTMDFSHLNIAKESRIKLALLSSFTIEPLGVYLDIETRMLELFPDIFVGGFNLFRQEILNKDSEFYKFKPDITILATNLDHLVNKLHDKFYNLNLNEKQDLVESVINELESLAIEFKMNSSGILIINNFILPIYSPLGILDTKENMGIREFYQIINQKIISKFKKDDKIYIFDLNKMASGFGIQNTINYKMHYMASMEFSELFLPYLVKEYISSIKAFKGMTKKCIVLDLDNTLWGGIIGEDGMEGIKLDNTFPGNQFVDFQKSILRLNERGIILAINSKNNFDDAIEVIRNHPSMILKEQHFASIKINWETKVKNMVDISKEIGIGLESMVFFDDNAVERHLINKALPEVLVVDLPKSASLYKKTLENLRVFDLLSLTDEDKKRGEMYLARKERKKLEKSLDLDNYLQNLEISIKIDQIDDFTEPRIANLLMKTNQFNLTTKRYVKAEIQDMRQKSNVYIYYLQVKDRFGDEGIVGVTIINEEEKVWIIDSFLMSCRIIGRKIENAFFNKILGDAKKKNIESIKGIYIKTKKNDLVKNFYKNLGFNLLKEDDEGSEWILSVKDVKIKKVDFIKIEEI